MLTSSKTGLLALVLCLILSGITYAQSNIHSSQQQIKAAVSPAPENLQEGAKVLGYDKNGKLVTLREGTNQLICLGDDPEQSNFHVACYHKDLEPFMKMGRELRAKGLSRKKVDSLRKVAIKEGKIDFPRKPMALYSLTGSSGSYDYSTGQVINASPLYVVYIPFATPQSTGLSERPVSKGAPWIMEPGEPWAHIMVMTRRKVGKQMKEQEK